MRLAYCTTLLLESLILVTSSQGPLSRKYGSYLRILTRNVRTWTYLQPTHAQLDKPRNIHQMTRTHNKSGKGYTEADYLVEDNIRSVIPYVHNFVTHAKGRWLGRELIEVLTREFGGHPVEYWKNAILYGHVRINNKIVSETYRFKNGDPMLHRTHRHEPAVAGQIVLVGETDTLLAISKPPSIPV